MDVGKGLSRVDASAGRLARADDVGDGTDVSEVDFSLRVLTHEDDMPTVFRVGASAMARPLASGRQPGSTLVPVGQESPPKPPSVIDEIVGQTFAAHVRQLEKPRRSNGRVVRRRVGWRATPELIMITTAEQDLQQRGERRYLPGGPWQIEHRVTYRHQSGKAEKRAGKVPCDPPSTDRDGGSRQTGATDSPEARVASRFPDGADALSFLPRAVRATVIDRIPEPTMFDGDIVQYSRGSGTVVGRYEVNLIRMDYQRAVVVHARRDEDAKEWDVTQATYLLSEPQIEQA